ncbi:hypothetical protein ACHWQZ_G002131 [Mnemiopsis leidyi]
MERLKEEGEEDKEEDAGEDGVRFPTKGKEYVVLPTSDMPKDADEIRKKRRRKKLIIGGTISALLILVVIVVCVVFLVLKKPRSQFDDDDDEGPIPVPDPFPNLPNRNINCNLAGLTFSQELCEASGCEVKKKERESVDGNGSNNDTESIDDGVSDHYRCVYPKGGLYTVKSKKITRTAARMTLQLAVKSTRSKRSEPSVMDIDDQHAMSNQSGTVEEIKSEIKPLVDLPEVLNVVITNEGGRTIRIKVSEPTDKSDDEEDETGPPTKRGMENSSFRLETAEPGQPFFVVIRRTTSGEEEEQVILDTRGYPLTVSEHLVQFAGLFGTTEIHSNGKELGPGDDIMIWNSKENSNLPYFYGGANKANTKLFGVAMDSSAPLKISFSSAGKENSNDIVVESTQLGGDFNMVLFLGPSRKDLTTQFVQTFGLPYRPPWWSLGTIVQHHPNHQPLNNTVYKIDVLVLESLIDVSDSSQQIKAKLTYVDPLVQLENTKDPKILTSEGDEFEGSIFRSGFPGSFRFYVDYTHKYTEYDNRTESLYSVSKQGYVLRHNYPLNYHNLQCEDNIINNSPFLDLTDYAPLYNDTICLDYLHTGEGLKGPRRYHRLVHNQYGTKQASILHKHRTLEGTRVLLLSDSVSLGAGQYTAKYLEVVTEEDLYQVIPSIISYGRIGMLAITRLGQEATDENMIVRYHKLNAFLLLTSGEEKALSQLGSSELSEIKDFIKTKYNLYPEWLTALHKSCETDGLPVIREMSFNFPEDPEVAGKDLPLQFMVGDKIVVAAGALLGNETKVYLPSSHNETWYRRSQSSYQRVYPQQGMVSINSSRDPTQLYYVRGSSVLMTSRLQDVDKISGNPIEYTKREYTEMTIFMTEDDEEIHETFYLREKIDSLLQVAVSVTSSDEGMRILLEPSGPALDMNSSDQRTWNQITVAADGLRGRVSSVTMNGAALTAIGYSYNTREWETSPLIILEDSEGDRQPSLHKTYDIMISYKDA